MKSHVFFAVWLVAMLAAACLEGCGLALPHQRLILVAGTVAVLAVYAAEHVRAARQDRKRRDAIFISRSDIDPKDIYAQYFKSEDIQEADFLRLWRQIADLLHVSPSKLRPSDRLTVEFRYSGAGIEEDDAMSIQDLFVAECRKRGLKRTGPNDCPDAIGDVVRSLLRRQRQGQT